MRGCDDGTGLKRNDICDETDGGCDDADGRCDDTDGRCDEYCGKGGFC